jgi:hypothetical protein
MRASHVARAREETALAIARCWCRFAYLTPDLANAGREIVGCKRDLRFARSAGAGLPAARHRIRGGRASTWQPSLSNVHSDPGLPCRGRRFLAKQMGGSNSMRAKRLVIGSAAAAIAALAGVSGASAFRGHGDGGGHIGGGSGHMGGHFASTSATVGSRAVAGRRYTGTYAGRYGRYGRGYGRYGYGGYGYPGYTYHGWGYPASPYYNGGWHLFTSPI